MTQEEATYEAPAPFPEAGYIVFGIPDVPYSSVRLPMVWDINELNVLVAQSMEAAKLVREAYQEAFGQAVPVRPPSVPDRSPAVPRGQAQARPTQPRKATDLDPAMVVKGNCPDHGIQALPSKLEYQEIEMSDTGEERYAKYYCTSPEGRHSLWARQLVPA